MKDFEVGYIVDGQFVCLICGQDLLYGKSEDQIIRAYKSNIGSYSQQCTKCYETVVEGTKRLDGGSLNLFPVQNLNAESVALEFAALIEKAEKEEDFEALDSLRKKMVKKFVSAVAGRACDCVPETAKYVKSLLEGK